MAISARRVESERIIYDRTTLRVCDRTWRNFRLRRSSCSETEVIFTAELATPSALATPDTYAARMPVVNSSTLIESVNVNTTLASVDTPGVVRGSLGGVGVGAGVVGIGFEVGPGVVGVVGA